MESMLQMSEAAIRANISYLEAVRNKAAQEALNALAEELKWTKILEMKKNPEITLKDLLTTDCI